MTNEEFYEFVKSKGIPLQIGSGWVELVKELIVELRNAGWDGKVTCIKEKYGELRFYIDQRDKALHKIIDKYTYKSIGTCETCGKKARQRHWGSWITTECIWHDRQFVFIENVGFRYFNSPTNSDYFFRWEEFSDIWLDDDYKFVNCKFINAPDIPSGGPVFDGVIKFHFSFKGWYQFVKSVPPRFKSFDYDFYPSLAAKLQPCPCCGYIAVKDNKCLCCDEYNLNLNGWHPEEYIKYVGSEEYIKDCQISWYSDEGDKVEALFENFEKVNKHTILFTLEEIEEYDPNEYMKDQYIAD